MFKDCLHSSSKANREEKTKKKNMSKRFKNAAAVAEVAKLK
jgi:hypothetical protein